MRKSFLASTLGAIAISIAALTAPVFAHDAPVVQPHPQVYATSVQARTTYTLPIGFQLPANSAPISQHAKHLPEQAVYSVAKTMQKNGTQVREFTKSAAKGWNNHQLRQRHPHTMQG